MSRSPSKRSKRISTASNIPGRAELAAEFLKRNRNYRAEHAQMQQRIRSGSVARSAAEAAFAKRWGLSFRLCAG
jgi:hypothetical protein